MSSWDRIAALPLWLLVPLALAAGVAAWRGWLGPGALRGGPGRGIGLGLTDLLVGGGLMLGGMSFGSLLLLRAKDAPLAEFVAAMIGAQLLSLGLPALYLGVRAARQPDGLRRIGYLPTRPGRDVAAGTLGAALALMTVPGVMLLGAIAGILLGHEPATIAHELLVKLRDADSRAGAWMLAFSAVLLAPVLEEMVYRGLWQSMMVETLGGRRRWAAVMLAAVIFAAMHVGGVEATALPALWVLGVMLGWMYERTGSLLPCVLTHMAFNAFNVGYVVLFVPTPQSPAG